MANPHAETAAVIFLRRQLELLAHRKTQREIAHEAGFTNANMLSLMKVGSSKIPLDRVPSLARAMEVDPARLMQLALEQSIGKTNAAAILQVFGTPTTENERGWLNEIRDASDQTDPRLTTRSRTALRAIFGR
ncbi:helix-turn-helix transcriptional regulator [Paracoccus aestuariivivens]|uniref:XRE family transcriptional regulator n=1 Tax=Paracoccus aestuariivivens TaxID=1820333 RepID=A0A6L6JAK1_9RHOB|nr:helix-turn-helix transcriptional regulator [Paracoccus aestuariivivens]MTH77164.1 XRE family transcriptional regulator [Paracoccus aestuariivivens]